jgi:hypothetical protein
VNGPFGAIRHAERILFFAESLQFQGNKESCISKVKTMMRSALRAGARAPGGGRRTSRIVQAKSPKWNDLAEKVREASNVKTDSRKLLPVPLKPDEMGAPKGYP